MGEFRNGNVEKKVKRKKKTVTIPIKTYEKKTLDQLKTEFRKWLSVEDTDWLDIILACSLDRKIEGEPLWLFVIGSPSSGKTELLRCFEDGKDFFQLSTLTANSLISGYIQPNGQRTEDLATQLDGKVLILKDFTSVLSMPKEKRGEIVGQLREYYDGYYMRKLGNINKKIEIYTSFGLITGVTFAIDRHFKILSELGERFLKLRCKFDEDLMLKMSEKNEGREREMREALKNAVMGFVTNVEILDVTFTEEQLKEIKEIAKFIATLRTPVFDRWTSDGYVIDTPPKPEAPIRIHKQLKKLARALCCIYGLNQPNEAIIKKLWRVAIDSIPEDRARVYSFIKKHKTISETALNVELNIPLTTLKRILQGLQRLGVISSNKEGFDLIRWSLKGEKEGSTTPCINNGFHNPKNIQGVVCPNKNETEEIDMTENE